MLGNGGAVQEVWDGLQDLKELKWFSSLAWLSERQGFVESADFRMLALAPLHNLKPLKISIEHGCLTKKMPSVDEEYWSYAPWLVAARSIYLNCSARKFGREPCTVKKRFQGY